jgi:hypothetical protein
VNLEAYDEDLAVELLGTIRRKLQHAREVSLEEVNNRGGLQRFLDGTARLFNPFL